MQQTRTRGESHFQERDSDGRFAGHRGDRDYGRRYDDDDFDDDRYSNRQQNRSNDWYREPGGRDDDQRNWYERERYNDDDYGYARNQFARDYEAADAYGARNVYNNRDDYYNENEDYRRGRDQRQNIYDRDYRRGGEREREFGHSGWQGSYGGRNERGYGAMDRDDMGRFGRMSDRTLQQRRGTYSTDYDAGRGYGRSYSNTDERDTTGGDDNRSTRRRAARGSSTTTQNRRRRGTSRHGRQGFASMPREDVRRIASMAGKASQRSRRSRTASGRSPSRRTRNSR